MPKPGAARTPTRLAIVMPPIIPATAAVTFPGGAIFDRIIAPTPKNAPWGNPETSRPSASMA